MTTLKDLEQTFDAVSVTDGNISINLTDSQAEWVTENLVSFLQNSDPSSKLRTNFLTKVLIPAAYKMYLPHVLILIGASAGLGYFIAKAAK